MPAKQPTEPLTIADFSVGGIYSTAKVAAFFQRSRDWVVDQCNAGRFPGAKKLDGGRSWVIPGTAVRQVYGAEQIERDRLADGMAMPTPTATRKRVDDALKKLEEFEESQKAKPKRKAK